MCSGRVAVLINAVGVTLRRCRVHGAATYGVHAMATFGIEECTIGECARGGFGGGILARAGVDQRRGRNGFNENRVQRDHNDTGYAGYSPIDCRGCLGRCTCSAMISLALSMNQDLIKWKPPGQGKWQLVGGAPG